MPGPSRYRWRCGCTRAVLESEIVNNRVTDWLGEAIATATELSPDEVAAVVDTVDDSPEMQFAIDDVVDQAVAAALAPPGTATHLDLSAAAESMAPVVAEALERRGVVSDADAVRAAAGDIPGILLSADGQMTVSGAAVLIPFCGLSPSRSVSCPPA